MVLACYAGGSLLATATGYGLMLREVRPGRLSLGLIGRTLRLGASMFVTRIAFMMVATHSDSASRISLSSTVTVFGTPSIRLRPLISIVIG